MVLVRFEFEGLVHKAPLIQSEKPPPPGNMWARSWMPCCIGNPPFNVKIVDANEPVTCLMCLTEGWVTW